MLLRAWHLLFGFESKLDKAARLKKFSRLRLERLEVSALQLPASDALAGERYVGKQCNLLIGAAKGSVKELKEAGEPE